MQRPGLIVAPLTPFTRDLKIDEKALARQIDYIIAECSPSWIVAAAVEAQEYTYLSLDERKALVRNGTVELVAARCPVMVGISHPSFRTAIELAHFAEGLGAAAVQMLAPLRAHGGPPTDRDLVAYFEAVGRETALPMTLYLNAGPGADVSIPATIALSKLERVHFIKESSRDLARVSRLIVEIDPCRPCQVLLRRCRCCLPASKLGGAGATACRPPGAEIARHVIDAFVARRAYARAAGDPAPICALPGALDASRPDADDEGGDDDHRRARRRSLPALRRTRRGRGQGARSVPEDDAAC